MRHTRWISVVAMLLLAASGCGKPADSNISTTSSEKSAATTSVAKADSPAAAAHEFLEALRTGNDEKAANMLSKTAREKTASLAGSVTPPASDTARFEVGKVDYVGNDGARVACTWTDLDAEDQPRTDQAVWVLRREEEGWRIVGVAAQVPDFDEPLVLNFEDPEEMFRRQQEFRDELRRRMEAEAQLQAKDGENQKNPIRR